jgi:ketosteroid isomerase-like protein
MDIPSLFASIDAKRTQQFLGFLTEDAVFRYGSNPRVVGRSAIELVVDQVFASIRSCSHRVLRVWEHPGSVICQGEVTYVRLDGRSIVLPFCNVFELRDERIARYEIYIDPGPLTAP